MQILLILDYLMVVWLFRKLVKSWQNCINVFPWSIKQNMFFSNVYKWNRSAAYSDLLHCIKSFWQWCHTFSICHLPAIVCQASQQRSLDWLICAADSKMDGHVIAITQFFTSGITTEYSIISWTLSFAQCKTCYVVCLNGFYYMFTNLWFVLFSFIDKRKWKCWFFETQCGSIECTLFPILIALCFADSKILAQTSCFLCKMVGQVFRAIERDFRTL